MTVRTFSDLSATQRGQTDQINRAYKGMADEMKRKQNGFQTEYNDLSSLSPHQLRRLVIQLTNDLADAQRLIEEMRAESNSDVPAVSTKTWTTAQVAEKSGVAICTICRNADKLGGTQLASGDWVFPVGTTYGRRRKAK